MRGDGPLWRYSTIRVAINDTSEATRHSEQRARYGFTWRGIKRPHDRELGIAGGELIVIDLQTTKSWHFGEDSPVPDMREAHPTVSTGSFRVDAHCSSALLMANVWVRTSTLPTGSSVASFPRRESLSHLKEKGDDRHASNPRFAVLQAVAETYLDGVNEAGQLLRDFGNGNNHYNFDPATGDGQNAPHRTADQVVPRQLRHRRPLRERLIWLLRAVFLDRRSGEYTISFRSLEYANESSGGDWMRDGVYGASGEVSAVGIAFAQVASMERYLENLRQGRRFDSATNSWVADLKLVGLRQALSAGAGVNVTGYSLGGHLANVFAVLHGDLVKHTYLFNAAGLGRINGLDPTSADYAAALRQKLAIYNAVILGDGEAWNRIAQTGEIMPGVTLSAVQRQELSWRLLATLCVHLTRSGFTQRGLFVAGRLPWKFDDRRRCGPVVRTSQTQGLAIAQARGQGTELSGESRRVRRPPSRRLGQQALRVRQSAGHLPLRQERVL